MYFDAAGGRGVIGRGATLPEAFAQVALGVFALMADPASVEERDAREVRAHGTAPEKLLVNWLNECLYVHEIEGFAVARVEVDTCRDGLVHGVLHGEPLDATRHRLGTIVKAATHHQVQVRESEGRIDVRVIVDV